MNGGQFREAVDDFLRIVKSAVLVQHQLTKNLVNAVELLQACGAIEQGKGIGKSMLASIIDATPGHRLEASCLPPATKMMRLLAGSGFKLIHETQGGKKTYRFTD